MPGFGWRSDRSVDDWLFGEPYEFDFLQAVRLLEMRAHAQDPTRLDDAGPAGDAVRFRTSFDLSFAPSEVQQLEKSGNGALPEMTVAIFGTGGVDGPLPMSFSEDILERLGKGDTAAAAFLDIFHHRLLTLLYRIHKVHRTALVTVTPDRTPFARYVLSLIGLGLQPLSSQLASPESLLRYGGLLATRPRSAVGLAALVSDYFHVRADVQQFVGEWFRLEPEHCTHIGITGRNQALGRTAVVGTRAWIQDAGVQQRLGPLDAAQFGSFLPGGDAHAALAELVSFYAGDDLRVGIQLVVRPEDVSQARLGQARIGWSGWLQTMRRALPDEQVRVRLTAGDRSERGAA
jgi:type VI secretion system protein ImpH